MAALKIHRGTSFQNAREGLNVISVLYMNVTVYCNYYLRNGRLAVKRTKKGSKI